MVVLRVAEYAVVEHDVARLGDERRVAAVVRYAAVVHREFLPGVAARETAGEECEAEEETVSISVIVNNTPVVLEGKSEYVSVDVFETIDFDRSRTKGMGIVTTLNGRPAQYMEAIHDGDVLEIYWRA